MRRLERLHLVLDVDYLAIAEMKRRRDADAGLGGKRQVRVDLVVSAQAWGWRHNAAVEQRRETLTSKADLQEHVQRERILRDVTAKRKLPAQVGR